MLRHKICNDKHVIRNSSETNGMKSRSSVSILLFSVALGSTFSFDFKVGKMLCLIKMKRMAKNAHVFEEWTPFYFPHRNFNQNDSQY